MRQIVSISTLIVLIGLTGPAAGQDDDARDWRPKRYSQTELIDFGTHAESPLLLPWSIVRTEEVTNYGRIDFKHLVDANFGEVARYFDKKHDSQKPALQLKSGVVPDGTSRQLNVFGVATQGDTRNFTLGNGDLRRSFLIRVRAASKGRTEIVFQNMTHRQIFGAGLPRLAPFTPLDAEPISFGR